MFTQPTQGTNRKEFKTMTTTAAAPQTTAHVDDTPAWVIKPYEGDLSGIIADDNITGDKVERFIMHHIRQVAMFLKNSPHNRLPLEPVTDDQQVSLQLMSAMEMPEWVRRPEKLGDMPDTERSAWYPIVSWTPDAVKAMVMIIKCMQVLEHKDAPAADRIRRLWGATRR